MKNNDRAEVLGVVGDEGVQEEKRRAGGFPEVRLTYIDAVRKKLACCHRVRVPRRFVTLLARSYDSSRALRVHEWPECTRTNEGDASHTGAREIREDEASARARHTEKTCLRLVDGV